VANDMIVHGGLVFLEIDGVQVADVESFRYQRPQNLRPHKPLGHAHPKEIVNLGFEAVSISFEIAKRSLESPELKKLIPQGATPAIVFNHPDVTLTLMDEVNGQTEARATKFRVQDDSANYTTGDMTVVAFSGLATMLFTGDQA
jgi:hypothetical protein